MDRPKRKLVHPSFLVRLLFGAQSVQRLAWTKNGVPTVETVRRLGIDFPDVVKLVQENGG